MKYCLVYAGKLQSNLFMFGLHDPSRRISTRFTFHIPKALWQHASLPEKRWLHVDSFRRHHTPRSSPF